MFSQYQNIIIPALFSLSIILLFWNIGLQIAVFSLRKKLKIFFQGKNAKNLEEIVLQSNQKITVLDKDIKDLYEITNKIHGLAFRGIHKTSVIRFNPFRDLGGDQSFCVALLDGKNNGTVISSLYSRDGVRVYAKGIVNGQSIKYPLTDEEKLAIAKATIEKTN